MSIFTEYLPPKDQKAKHFVISGTNYWNPGDDFVRDGVINVLRAVFPDHMLNFQFYNFNADFFPQSKFSGISNFVAKGDLEQSWEFVDAVIIAGLSAGDEIKDLYRWVIANGLEKRVYLIGAGYENSYVAQHIRLEPERTIFKNARLIIGRTEKTPDFIANHDIPYRRLNCPALLSVPAVKKVPPGKKIEKIGFSIQLSHEQGIVNQSCDESQSKLAIAMLLELSKGYAVEVVAHHKTEYFYFLRLLRDKQIPVVFSSFYQDLFSIYPRYDLVITTRLHSSLFANGHGIPGIIINNTDRHTHTLEGFPHSVWVANREAFEHEFAKVKGRDLGQIAQEADVYKQDLTQKYVNALSEPFGIQPAGGQPLLKPQEEADLPIHFFSIVLNGMPFIEHHIKLLSQLPFQWHWHIIEGVADLKHDTAWPLKTGGRITDQAHKDGLSKDGTTEYLNKLAQEYPKNATIYRKPAGQFWDGKIEMVNRPLENLRKKCLLWQIDVDELWTLDQLIRGRDLFLAHPNRTAAFYYCHYYVGEDRVISTRGTYGNHPEYEWLRTWRFTPGARWTTHEPPRLCQIINGKAVDLASIHPFRHEETEANGLVFHHYAYAIREQLEFKQNYYGYADAVSSWERLQSAPLPVLLRNFFGWVKDEAEVVSAKAQGIQSIFGKDAQQCWRFNDAEEKPAAGRVLLMRTDSIGDNVLATSLLPYLRRKYLGAHIGVFCQKRAGMIYQGSTYVDEVIEFDRKRSLENDDYREAVVRQLRAFKADLVLNLVYSREPLSDRLLPKNGSVEIIGFEGDTSNISDADRKRGNELYSRLIASPGHDKPELDRHRDFLAGLGIQAGEMKPNICLGVADKQWAEELFAEHRLDQAKTIALFPGAQHDYKVYRDYATALKFLKGFRFLIFGGHEVTALGEEVAAELPGCLNLCGKTTLLEMAAAFQKCRLYVGADSAGAHLACAVGLRNVVIIGGGHFGRFFPYSARTSIVCLPLQCYNCNWACEHNYKCIVQIVPEVISEAVRRTLSEDSDKARVFAQTHRFGIVQGEKARWVSAEQFINKDVVEIIEVQPKIHLMIRRAVRKWGKARKNQRTGTAERLPTA